MLYNLNFFFKELLLIFLSRQGFWSENKNITNKNLFLLTYQYICSSIVIIISMLFLKKRITELLTNLYFADIISYFDILFYGLYIILFVGIIYENYFFIKLNSISTFNIFFRFSIHKIRLLNFLKNLIVVLPALIFLSFYNILFPFIFFTLIHIFSFFILNRYFIIKRYGITFLKKKNIIKKPIVNIKYILSVVPLKDFIKYTITPWFSILILVLIETYNKDIMLFSNYYSVFFTGLILSSIFFNSKLPAFVFLSLNLDIPYIRALSINIKRFLWKYIIYISLFQVITTVLFFQFITIYFFNLDRPMQNILFISLILGYFLMSFIQIIQSFYYKNKSLKSPFELEAYKLPIKKRLVNYLYNIFIVLSFMIFNRVNSDYQNIIMYIFLMIVFLIFIYLIRYINKVLGGLE